MTLASSPDNMCNVHGSEPMWVQNGILICRGDRRAQRCIQANNQLRHQTQPSATSATPDVTKCHACHTKATRMSPSATPATQSAAPSRATSGDYLRHQRQSSAVSATPATQKECGCRQVPRLQRKVLTKLSVCVCDKVVCERLRVTKNCL